jgi:hypothetical protein
MKLMNGRLLVARIKRLTVAAVAMLALCQLLAGVVTAQTLWAAGLHQTLAEVVQSKEQPRDTVQAADPGKYALALTPRSDDEQRGLPIVLPRSLELPLPDDKPANDQKPERRTQLSGFNWDGAFRQSMIFLGVQHAFRLTMEPGTRAGLRGPFFKDYFRTVRSLRGWNDGDPFIVNYIGHPMMGAVTGYIQIHNDPRGIKEEVGLKNKNYWKSRLKALGWSAAYSTQFELGLVSEATIGNIGMVPNKKSRHPMGYVDLVATPVVGTAWLVGEDLVDKHIIRPLEKYLPNRFSVIVCRTLLNPSRTFANLTRWRWIWRREDRP